MLLAQHTLINQSSLSPKHIVRMRWILRSQRLQTQRESSPASCSSQNTHMRVCKYTHERERERFLHIFLFHLQTHRSSSNYWGLIWLSDGRTLLGSFLPLFRVTAQWQAIENGSLFLLLAMELKYWVNTRFCFCEALFPFRSVEC